MYGKYGFVISCFVSMICILHSVTSANAFLGENNHKLKEDVEIHCKDENGNYVDWFIAYKLPMDSSSSDDPALKRGSAYFYLISSEASPTWKRSTKDIDALDSILGLTLQQLYTNNTTADSDSLAYVLYNDQPPHPDPPVVYNGHTKGAVLTKAAKGFWLVHSVPHFPKHVKGQSQEGYYPFGGLENGQLFLCLSLPREQIDAVIGNALLYTKPHIYNYSIPAAMNSLLPKLEDIVVKNATQTQPPWFTLSQVKTNDGLDFMVFVKGVKFRKDVYSSWISDKLGTGLDVQSWLQGTHPIQSDCTHKYSVYNILTKEMTPAGGTGLNFTCHNDHSKWANGIEQPWTCVSDLNRMKPQKTRGGVTLCVSNKNIWSAFKSLVQNIQPCNKIIKKF